MRLIVGLGNPGPEFERTRHNLGALTVEKLRKRVGKRWQENSQLSALILKFNPQTYLMFPQTFMNRSGEAVEKAAERLKVKPEEIWVICDDANLTVGRVRVRQGGEGGGHHGLQSIISRIGPNFWRIRIGIAPERGKIQDLEKFVLEKTNPKEWQQLEKVVDKLVEKMVEWVTAGKIEPTTFNFIMD